MVDRCDDPAPRFHAHSRRPRRRPVQVEIREVGRCKLDFELAQARLSGSVAVARIGCGSYRTAGIGAVSSERRARGHAA